MPLHRKPTHRLKVLAATLGVAGTVSGVAVAAQVGSESVGSAPEALTATSAPASPLSSAARVPEDHGDRGLRPTRSASTRRAPLPHRQTHKPKASEGSASPTTTAQTDPVPGADVKPSVAPSTREAGRTPTPTTRSRTSGTSILEATNAARGSDGEAALGVDSCLQRMAQQHAERLASAGRLYHQDLGDVMRSCGMSTAGENVAMNYTGASDMVDQWLDSPGHRANLLSSRFSLIGIGVAQARDGAWYGVQVFGGH